MKKLVLSLVAATMLVACDNGMDEGFERLSENLAEVIAEFEQVNAELESSLAEVTADVEAAVLQADQTNTALEEAIAIIAQINADLDSANEALAGAATDEDVASLLAQVTSLQEAVTLLRDYGDLDYDGIRNAVDKCPNTAPGVEVDLEGCPIGD